MTVAVIQRKASASAWPRPTKRCPPLDELIELFEEEGMCEATDGCLVDSDDVCEHGHPSWMLVRGMV